MADKPAYRHVPYDIELEQALLGALLRDDAAYWRLEGAISEADFYDPLHQRIFEMIGDRVKRRMGVTPLTLNAAMKSDPGLMEVGGHAYLAGLAQAAPAMPSMKDISAGLRDLSLRRQLITIGEDIVNAAYEPPAELDGGSAESITESASEKLYELGRRTETGRGAIGMKDLAYEAIIKTEHARTSPAEVCLTSGLVSVDNELGGIYRSDLTIIAGAPGMGKSAFAQMMAKANGLGQKFGQHRSAVDADAEPQLVLFFSLEMADWQLGMREVADSTSIPSSLMRRGKVSPAEIEKMMHAHAEMRDMAVKVDSTPKLSVAQMRARAHALQRRSNGKLAMLIIDHLRFVRPANWKLDEKDQIQQITSDLKELAKELNVAVALLAHLNRDYNKRPSKRPINSDLYGASAIEQNADAIWFMHSESYFLQREEPPASDTKARTEWYAALQREEGWAEVFSTKARMDRIGKARVRFEPAFTRFRDPDHVEPGPPAQPDLLTRDPIDALDQRAPPVGT